MRTSFSTNSELCHVWAQQTQETGSASNLTFNGSTIYSYGHWPIAKFVEAKNGEKIVLFRDWVYSSSTGRQMAHAREALDTSIRVIFVNNPNNPSQSIADLVSSVKVSYNDFDNKRNKSNLLAVNGSSLQTLSELKDLLGWDVPDLCNYEIQAEPAMMAQVRLYEMAISKRREAKEARENARIQRANDILVSDGAEAARNQWRTNGRDSSNVNIEGYWHMLFREGPGLRIEDGEVVTSQGARVPIREAKILFARLRAGKDIIGFKIGYYTVLSVNGCIKIGCHRITREEIDIFARINKW